MTQPLELPCMGGPLDGRRAALQYAGEDVFFIVVSLWGPVEVHQCHKFRGDEEGWYTRDPYYSTETPVRWKWTQVATPERAAMYRGEEADP